MSDQDLSVVLEDGTVIATDAEVRARANELVGEYEKLRIDEQLARHSRIFRENRNVLDATNYWALIDHLLDRRLLLT